MVSRAATSAALEAAARSSTRGRGGAPSGLASSLGAPGQPDLWRRGSRPRALPGWSTLSVLRHWYCQGVLLQVSSGLVLTWGAPHGTVCGTCGTPEAGTRETHAQCCPARGKLPCASSGTHGTREAGIHVPCTCGARLRLQHGCGPLWPHVDTGADPRLLDAGPREAVLRDDPADEGGHRDAAVLDLRLAVPPQPAQHRVARERGVSLRGAGTRGQRSFERDRRAPEDRAAVRTVPRRPCRRWSPWPAAAGPTARCPTRRRSRLGVANKAAQTSASWRSWGRFERSIVFQAAPSCGQPRPISRLGPRWPATSALFSTCVATELDQHLAGLIPVLVPPGRVWRSTGRTGSDKHAASGSAHRWVRGSNGGQSQV